MKILFFAVGATILLLGSVPRIQAAEIGLTGLVSSAEQPAMEGVLVSIRQVGSSRRITVVSDGDGRYNFPANKLEAGAYTIEIRAGGYDLD